MLRMLDWRGLANSFLVLRPSASKRDYRRHGDEAPRTEDEAPQTEDEAPLVEERPNRFQDCLLQAALAIYS